MATLNFPDSPTTGDVYTDSNSGFTYEWNGTVWISTDPSTASNIREIDDISGDFDGSDTDFTLKVSAVNVEPVNAQQLIISVGGVMQNAGDDFTVSGSTITFTTAPQSGLSFFGTLLGTALSLNTIADGTVTPSALTTTSNYVMNGLTLDQGAGIITAFGFQGGSITADLDSTFSGNVSIAGSLTVQGTQTIINVDELNIQDKTIGIGSTNAPSSTSQDGAGAIIYGQTHIDILYDREKASLGISTAVTVTGVVTATNITANDSSKPSLSLYTGSTLRADLSANSGVTSIRSYANSPFSINVGGSGETEALRVLSGGQVAIGTLTEGRTDSDELTLGGAGDVGLTIRSGTSNFGNIYFSDATSGAAEYAGYVQYNHTNNSLLFGANSAEKLRITSDGKLGIGTEVPNGNLEVSGTTTYQLVLRDSDNTGNGAQVGIGFYGIDSAVLGYIGPTQWENGNFNIFNNTSGGDFVFSTHDGSSTGERLRLTSGGGVSFNNGQLVERVKITAGRLSDNTNIDLENGMVHYFTTQENTTCTPNIRVSSSTELNDVMDAGDVITVTLITTAAAAGYSANILIDSQTITEEWVGGAAPTAGSADGLDIYCYTIICTHATNTGDSGFKVIANLTNATN